MAVGEAAAADRVSLWFRKPMLLGHQQREQHKRWQYQGGRGSRPAWAVYQDPVSKDKRKRNRKIKEADRCFRKMR